MFRMIRTWRMPRWLLALMILALAGCAAISTKSYKDLEYPPLGEVQIPPIERVELDNGMILYLVEDHEFPTIDLRARIRTGSMVEPADKIGLAGTTGQVMRTGGTTSISGDELDEILEGMAASVETWIGGTEGGASMSLMKEDLDKGLEILADVLMHPAFPDDKIKLAKIQAKSGISRRNDDPWQITFREFNKLIYGPDHPYARHTEYATIEAITRGDMIAFHRRYFHPNNVIVAVWGDFDTEEMKEKILGAFGDWKSEETAFPPVSEIVRDRPPSVNYIYKEDVNQTNIFVGHLGVRADDPHYHALILLQEILGGGVTSRLFKEVRSNLGLAYSVWATSGVGFHHPGVFYAGCSTKSASTHAALDAMMTEVKRITEEEVADEELELAKERIRNSYVFNFDTKGEIVGRKVFYEFYGYPTDFLEKYREGIEKATKADVLEAAKACIHPDRFIILAVGRSQDFDKPLDDLGPVHTIDITIPEATPAEEIPEADQASLKRGQEIMAAAVEAMGGQAAFAGIKDVSMEMEMTIQTPQGAMSISLTTYRKYPDRVRVEIQMPFGKMIQAVAGESGWIQSPQGVMDMPSDQLDQAQKKRFSDLVRLFGHFSDLKVQALPSAEVEGKPVDVLVIADDRGNWVKLFLDAVDHRLVKKEYPDQGMAGPVQAEDSYGDYRKVSGLLFPFRTKTKHDGEDFAETTVGKIQVNTGLDESLFARP